MDQEPINEGQPKPLNESQPINNRSHKRKGWKIKFIIANIIIALLCGAMGGFLTIQLFGQNGVGLFSKSFTNNKIERSVVEESSATIQVVKDVSPSVVSITMTENQQDLFGNTNTVTGAGTGFLVSNDGLILTNKHIILNQGAEYTVATSDGKSYKGSVKAVDPLTDLAFLKIEISNAKAVDLGDSNNLEVGQRVVAIGNALGQYQNTVTEGIISGKNRSIIASDGTGQQQEKLEDIIQTDASINPGNSGGPLVALDGKVIGVNTAIDQGGQTIGFAIPINIAKTAIESLQKEGRIIRPVLGVNYITLNNDIAALEKLSVSNGAYIKSSTNGASPIISGSPADKAGLKDKDIIIKVGDQAIDEKHPLFSTIQNYKPGDNLKIVFLRDGKENTVSVTLEEAK